MPSFDVVSEVDTHELTNAVDQAVRELTQRFDFKGTDATFELEETTVTMIAPADFQLKQMLDILKLRIAKRGIDVACLEVKDPEVSGARQAAGDLEAWHRCRVRPESLTAHQGFEAQSTGADSRREGAYRGQEAR